MPQDVSYPPKCFGSYLRHAISTDFEDFKPFKDEKLFFLVELAPAHRAATDFVAGMAKTVAQHAVEFGSVAHPTRYVTLRTDKAAVLDRDPETVKIWEEHVSRVELSLPLRSSQAASTGNAEPRRWETGGRSGSGNLPRRTLLGILDFGCPFAAARFLRNVPSAPASTRVFAIWDQDATKAPIPIPGGKFFGQTAAGFGFGVEYRRMSYVDAGNSYIGLDDWMKRHSAAGFIDEDFCYAEGKFDPPLKHRLSHGAHIMDLFVGKLPPSSRVGPAADHRDPPSWQPGNDLASDRRVDVVFVQFPRRCIEDHSGVWLPAYVPWGIDYILSCADPNQSEHIVINLSYGPTTGPHDGTDLLEAALATYVANYNGNGGKHELEIVVPAGNAYLSDGHVHFKRNVSGDPSQVEWIWRLPPDNTVRCFVEVWMKTAQVGGVNVTLTSPTGVVSPGAPVPWGTSTKWLLEVGPTVATLAAGAREHGDYRIKVTGVGVSAEVHAYAARTDPNLGVRSGAKPSRFIDADWEKNRSPEASHTRVNGEFDRTGSLIHRLGTLNGLATGNANRLRVAGGYVLGRVRGSPYSSAGPARGPLPPRNSPDLALPCDESHALRGMRGGGNRSGSVFRLIGTSAAAPQLARYVAGPPPMIPPAANAPAPGSNDEFKRGAGNLPAP